MCVAKGAVRHRRRDREQEIHRAVVEHLHLRGVRGLIFCHVPNGGYRRPTEAAVFKGLGALELKRPGGRPSEDQLRFLSDFEMAGGYTAICDDLDRALRTLEAWGLLRGTAAVTSDSAGEPASFIGVVVDCLSAQSVFSNGGRS
jgi:hypothetical protein